MKLTSQEINKNRDCSGVNNLTFRKKNIFVHKKITLRTIFIYSFLMISLISWGQKSQLKKADNFFSRGEYFEALKIYNQTKEEGHSLDIPTQIKVGHCYYHLNNVDAAYAIFSDLEQYLKGEDLFIYALTTHKVGAYEFAIDFYKQCRTQLSGKQAQIDELIKACEWAEKNQIFVPNVTVNPSTILTFGQSFGIQYYDKGVVYSSAVEQEPSKKSKKVKTDKQGMNFLNLFYSDLTDGQISSKGRLFSQNLRFDFHVGAISFTSDLKTMYYTKTVRIKGGDSRLKIYKVTYNGRDWINEEEISVNSNEFDNAHPAVSPDDKFLYFVSNRPGGYGGKDLYVVERKPNGTYGSPKNLGPRINTYGDEMYPYISKDNVLYFASDGHIGFGGLDLFKSEYVNGDWGKAENMMKPFNSEKDDFGYVIDPSNNRFGFISTNRRGDGSMDAIFYVLYSEEEKKEEIIDEVIEGITSSGLISTLRTQIISTFSNEPVIGATVVIKDTFTGNIVVQGVSGDNGRIELKIPDEYKVDNQEFVITVTKTNEYQPKTLTVNIKELRELSQAGIMLTPIFKEQKLNELSASKVPYIGKEITKEGLSELDKLAAYLLSNPHVVVKLNGHTDCRGNVTENLNTSQSMAEKAMHYLISKGVPRDQLIPRGYGERYILNGCKRGKLCSEKEHLENRRIEIVVWRFLK